MARGSVGVTWLRDLGSPAVTASAPRFCMGELAGRLVELSGGGSSAVLTAATKLILDAQAMREPVAWIGTDDCSFYPPDLAQSGVDLSALVVVRIPVAQANQANQANQAKRPLTTLLAVAAERLLRSGAFGLVLLDMSMGMGMGMGALEASKKGPVLGQPLQSRLLGLAQRHQAAVLFLTEKAEESPSLGSLISLRAHIGRTWLGRERFMCEIRVRKDKRRGPVWSEREVYRGPMGLR